MPYEFNPNDVHTEQILTDFSVKYQNRDTIWRGVAPIRQVNKRSDKFQRIGKDNSFMVVDDTIGPRGQVNEVFWQFTDDNYSVSDHALQHIIPLEAMENADDPIREELDGMELIREALDTAHEKRVADKFFAAATYDAAQKVTLSAAARWSDANSDPIRAIMAEIKNMIVTPNTLVLGEDTWFYLRNHPKVTAAIYPAGGNAQAGSTPITRQQFAAVLEIENVLVGRRRMNTAKRGLTPAIAGIWGAHALLARVEQNPGRSTVTLGITFSETQTAVNRAVDLTKGLKGVQIVKDGWNQDVKLIAGDAAFFWENAGTAG